LANEINKSARWNKISVIRWYNFEAEQAGRKAARCLGAQWGSGAVGRRDVSNVRAALILQC